MTGPVHTDVLSVLRFYKVIHTHNPEALPYDHVFMGTGPRVTLVECQYSCRGKRFQVLRLSSVSLYFIDSITPVITLQLSTVYVEIRKVHKT